MIPSKLDRWISEIQELCKPLRVHICDGSKEEYRMLCKELVDAGVFFPLNPEKKPNSFWCHSHPDDVARVEESTFICSEKEEDAGPTNNWKDPKEMKALLQSLFSGCMQGRVMYVIPFSMGPIGSFLSHAGVEITDSPYVACSMHIMTRVGKKAFESASESGFIPCVHSVGMPLGPGQKDTSWPCNLKNRYIVHFPEEKSVWSFGSGYGGNALLAKKSFALRIASVMARQDGWLAEHMLIMGLKNPKGKKIYVAAAFPSMCGKTNLAMLKPSLPGWEVTCVGDDIAWMKWKNDGRLYAVNPENGFFGVAPGTSWKTNPVAMEILSHDTIFTNVALTKDKDVWWEGLSKSPPSGLTSWLDKPWDPSSKEKASHPNARFTSPIENCHICDEAHDDPNGVPISAILFGGRRASVVPLVYESFSWQHGIFVGATVASETTAAAKGSVGTLRYDPFAMRPFCGYNMGKYFEHWLAMGKGRPKENLPKIFHVNWFRKSKNGEFLWPGYRENIRVLEWIFDRVEEKEPAETSPIGYLPKSLNLQGLSMTEEEIGELMKVDRSEWLEEIPLLQEHLAKFGGDLPKEILQELTALTTRLGP